MNFIKITEQPSIHEDLEQKSVRELLEGINEEDRKVASAVHACIPQIEKLVNEIVERMHQGGRIFYLGAGTSGRLGVLDASEIPPTFGMPDTCVIGIIAGGEQALRRPVENAEDDSQKGWMELQDHHITNKDILIGIAASGTTPYVIGALQKAREHGILTASISSNPGSPLSSVADIPIEMIVGPEFITGSSRMKSVRALDTLRHDTVDGIILIATMFTPEHHAVLQSLHVPVVIVGQQYPGFSCVFHDYFGAAQAAGGGVLNGVAAIFIPPPLLGGIPELSPQAL